MTGHHVSRNWGWDCHGVPIEMIVNEELGIKDMKAVYEMGIKKYDDACRLKVDTYAKEWEQQMTRVGRWIDFKNCYRTMDINYMESVWWVFKQIFNKGMVYKGCKIMPYSTACNTVYSNFEATQEYKDVFDPA